MTKMKPETVKRLRAEAENGAFKERGFVYYLDDNVFCRMNKGGKLWVWEDGWGEYPTLVSEKSGSYRDRAIYEQFFAQKSSEPAKKNPVYTIEMVDEPDEDGDYELILYKNGIVEETWYVEKPLEKSDIEYLRAWSSKYDCSDVVEAFIEKYSKETFEEKDLGEFKPYTPLEKAINKVEEMSIGITNMQFTDETTGLIISGVYANITIALQKLLIEELRGRE